MSVLLDPYQQYDDFVQKRNHDLFPKELEDELDIISVAKRKTDPDPIVFGSYDLRIQQYPGDIDLRQEFKRCCSAKATIDSFAPQLQSVIRRIMKNRIHYYSEAKIGLDPIYADLELGDLTDGIYQPDIYLPAVLTLFYEKKYFEGEDYDLIMRVFDKHTFNQNDYDIVDYVIKKYRILRWTEREILNGKKRLIGNRSITLKEALAYDTLCKVDEIIYFDNKFYEITDAYMLKYMKKIPGSDEYDTIEINPTGNPYIQLPIEAERLYYSDMWYSPFKAVKRVYALAKAGKNLYKPHMQDFLRKLFPFISSNTSLLYQIKGELDNMVILIDRVISPPIATIKKQLLSIRNKLDTVIDISNHRLAIYDKLLDKARQMRSSKPMKTIIKDILSMLKRKINYSTIFYLNSVGLNPFPRFLLPPKASYDWSKVRKPDDDPENPLDKYKDLDGEGLEGGCESCMNFDY